MKFPDSASTLSRGVAVKTGLTIGQAPPASLLAQPAVDSEHQGSDARASVVPGHVGMQLAPQALDLVLVG